MAITKDIQNGSEIFFNAWNGSEGYTLDLSLDKLLGNLIGTDPFSGQTGKTTLDAAVVAASELTNGVLFDGELTEFSTAFGGDFTDIEWSLVAYDNTGFNRTLVTKDTGTDVSTITNDQAKNLAGTLDNMANSVNGFEGVQGAEDTYHITASTDGAAYAGQFGSTYQGNVFDTSNALGAASDLFMVTQSTTESQFSNRDGLTQQLADTNGKAITATTYEEGGVWKLKIEVSADDAAITNYTQPAFSTFASTNVDSIAQIGDNLVLVGADGENETITGTEAAINFKDTTVNTADFVSAASTAVTFSNNVGGDPVVPTKYVGDQPLDYELLGGTTDDNITGSDSNDFMNLLGGNDAANGGAGNDVLDGGLDSNFLTGGTGTDTFFVDGRPQNGVVSTSWSTITDFEAGEFAILWGWVEGTSQQLLTVEDFGADGFTGYTYFYDLDGNGDFDSTITFTGLTGETAPIVQTDVNAGYLSFVLV